MSSKEKYDRRVLLDSVWHWLVEDGIENWDFLSGILEQNHSIFISSKKLKYEIKAYFKQQTGFDVYSKCIKCNGRIVPRKSRYGYFSSCSNFPRCDFKGVMKRSYIMDDHE